MPCGSSTPELTRPTGPGQAEWYSIVEGEHPLWNDVSEPYKHTIRAFLAHFNSQVRPGPYKPIAELIDPRSLNA